MQLPPNGNHTPTSSFSLVPQDHPFENAVQKLAARHQATILRSTPSELQKLREPLQSIAPEFVAVVIEPSSLDINLVFQFLELSTQLDDDPFVDFASGWITGRDAAAALKLVKASDPKQPKTDPLIKQLGVAGSAMPKSMFQKSVWPHAAGTVPISAWTLRGDTDESRDEAFLKDAIRKLNGGGILLLASHGYPNGLVGGPKAEDIRDIRCRGVAFNVACYTGVTGTWYEDDWASGKVVQRSVAPEDSFCLQMIDSGVAGYVAYVCPRPAGPTMFGDALSIATSGQSMGKHWQEQLNSVVLAHLMHGHDRLDLSPRVAGSKIKARSSFTDSVLPMSCGGILFGDPAFVPYAETPQASAVTTSVEAIDNGLLVDLGFRTTLAHFYFAEAINYWDGKSAAIRLETRVPIDNRPIESVSLDVHPFGDVPFQLVAAHEEHQGKHYLRMKAVFERPEISILQPLLWLGINAKYRIQFGESKQTIEPNYCYRFLDKAEAKRGAAP